MLSKSSEKYFSFLNKLKYFIYKLNINERKYFDLIIKGTIPRPHYAFGVFFSSSIASQLGYKKISLFDSWGRIPKGGFCFGGMVT